MEKNIVGFWGYPDPEIIKKVKLEYPNAEWVDLDVDFNADDKYILPDAYCKIIKNIINNSFKFNPVKILAPIGKEKCDSGWFAAKLLKEYGFNVIETIYEQKEHKNPINICSSNLPLFKKVDTVMNNIITPKQFNLPQTKPQFGFWGVPPNDMEILNLLFYANYMLAKANICEYNIKDTLEIAQKIQELNSEAFRYSGEAMELAEILKDLQKKSIL